MDHDKRKAGKWMKTIVKLAAAGVIAGGAVWLDNRMVSTTRYEVHSSKLPEQFHGYKIVQLSDLHSCELGENNKRLIEAVRRERPDVLFMTGDMVNRNDIEFHLFLELAQVLVAQAPVYFIDGNHEQRMNQTGYSNLMEKLNSLQIKLLNNEKVLLKKGGSSIDLYGMTIPLRYYKYPRSFYTECAYFTKQNASELLGCCEPSQFSLLLTHNPLYFPAYSGWGADLTLCGHMHGGMMGLPGGQGLFSPERRFFPRYCAGEFQRDSSVMIVSRGLGDGFGGIRVFNRPELVTITLSVG